MRQKGLGTSLASDVDHFGETDLSNDGAELSGSGRDTVEGGSVTGGSDFSGNDLEGKEGQEGLRPSWQKLTKVVVLGPKFWKKLAKQ